MYNRCEEVQGENYMGDGRYYTYYQFFDVIVITLLSIFAVFSIAYCYYRKNKEYDILQIHISLVLIMLISIIKLVESVIPNIELLSDLRSLIAGLILVLINITVITTQSIRRRKKIIVFLLITLITMSCMGTFVDAYDFHNIRYSIFYKILLSISVLRVFALVIKSFLDMNDLTKRGMVFKINIILLILPIFIYLILVVENNSYMDYFETLLLICITIFANVKFNISDKSSFAILSFDKIGDMGANYIFVIDTSFKIIYRNNHSVKSEFFVDTQSINIEKITEIFAGKSIKLSNHLGEEYILSKSESTSNYFTYKVGLLEEEGKNIGYIITITKITELIELLISLEEKKDESKSSNQRLKNYSEIVYHIEKEKEINILLEEIVNSRDEQMKCLSSLICDLKNKIDDELFEKYIDITIAKSNEILEDVRGTVSKYREYYGG